MRLAGLMRYLLLPLLKEFFEKLAQVLQVFLRRGQRDTWHRLPRLRLKSLGMGE